MRRRYMYLYNTHVHVMYQSVLVMTGGSYVTCLMSECICVYIHVCAVLINLSLYVYSLKIHMFMYYVHSTVPHCISIWCPLSSACDWPQLPSPQLWHNWLPTLSGRHPPPLQWHHSTRCVCTYVHVRIMYMYNLNGYYNYSWQFSGF